MPSVLTQLFRPGVLAGLATLFALAMGVVACDISNVNGPQGTAEEATSDASKEVFVVVEQMPRLNGGLQSVQANNTYPEKAKAAGIEGRVFIQFIVDEHGRVTEPKVVRGIGGGCDEAALAAITRATFEPGRQKGVAVPVKMSIPITFKLQDDM